MRISTGLAEFIRVSTEEKCGGAVGRRPEKLLAVNLASMLLKKETIMSNLRITNQAFRSIISDAM